MSVLTGKDEDEVPFRDGEANVDGMMQPAAFTALLSTSTLEDRELVTVLSRGTTGTPAGT